MFKVLVCGGRDLFDHITPESAETMVCETLSGLPNPPDKGDVLFISGMARGADSIPVSMVRDDPDWGGLMEFPADWKRFGNRAGPLRNIQMIHEGRPDLVLAFPTPKSRGTHHMIDISRKAGIEVMVIDVTDS